MNLVWADNGSQKEKMCGLKMDGPTGQNGPIPQFLEIFSKKKTVSEINGKVPLFLKLEFQKLEFLISFATMALLSWICPIKKKFAILELGKLEYHLHSTRVYQVRVPFFFLFGDNKKINIKIKISSFFMFLFI